MMRKVLKWVMVLLVISLVSCSKENNSFKSKGIITGQDYRMCICCGGWLITIDNQQYMFNALPENASINLNNEIFPLAVKLDWELNAAGCPNAITIQRIQKE